MYALLVSLLCVVASVSCNCPFSTPVMLWSTSGATTSADVLQSDYSLLALLRDSPVVVLFYHPVLTIEQFSKGADVYNAHSTSSKFDSLLRATRGYNIFAAETVYSGKRMVGVVESEANLSQKRISKVSLADFRAASFSNDMQYVFVALPAFDDATFSAHDFGEFVGKLGDFLKTNQLGHTIVYTGMESEEVCIVDAQLDAEDTGLTALRRRKRQLSNPVTVSGNSSYTYINVDNCLLFFSSLIQFGLTTTTGGQTTYLNFPLPPIYSPGNGSAPLYDVTHTVCNPNVTGTNATASLAFAYTNVASNTTNGTTLSFLWMDWQFSQTGTQIYGNWSVSSLTVSFELASASPNTTGFPSALFNTNITALPFNAVDVATSANVYAPLASSFHCTTMVLVPNSIGTTMISNLTGSTSVSLAMQMNNFQIQPWIQSSALVNGMPQFGPWNDCDMFFTIPILMAFFTMILMMGILLFAFCVSYTVTTFDSFDDKTSVISLGIQDT